MSADAAARPPRESRPPCGLPWCTTPHGATSHEADEHHRSAGRAVTLTLRGRRPDEVPHGADVELGLLRRRGEEQTWLLVEDGRGIHVELALADARELLRALGADSTVATELGLPARSH